jgi:hypothetical protein
MMAASLTDPGRYGAYKWQVVLNFAIPGPSSLRCIQWYGRVAPNLTNDTTTEILRLIAPTAGANAGTAATLHDPCDLGYLHPGGDSRQAYSPHRGKSR